MGDNQRRGDRGRRPFYRTVCLGMLFCLSLALAVHPAGGAEAQAGGTLTFGTENEFSGFDVLKATGFAINDAIANSTICERLFDMDDQGRLVPVLGLSAEAAADGRSWIVKLRRAVAFHDGTPFDANAVVAHWTRMLEPQNRFGDRALMDAIQAVERVDSHTVRFHLKHVWPPFLAVLCNPRTLAAFIPSPAAVAADRQRRAPVGTGPFMFEEWVSGDRFVVVRNPHYWQADKPRLDRIVFKPIPDEQTRYASLKSGQLDAIWIDRGQLIEKAEQDPDLRHYQGEGNGAEIIVFNTAAAPFDDVRVRRALAHAWNQPLYVKLNYRDCIPVVEQPMGASARCDETAYRAFDRQAAQRLMAEYGKPVSFACLHSNTQRGREIGEIMQQFFKPLGVAVQPQGFSFGPVVKKVISGQYQAATWRIPPSLDFGPYFELAFHSKSRRNWTRYHNPEMDRLLEAQRSQSDLEKRAALLCQVVRLINRDVPILYRGGKRFHVLARPEVKNIDPIRRGMPPLADVWLEN